MKDFNDYVSVIKDRLGVSEVRIHQKDVLETVFNGGDVFFMAPTGSGKSLTYEMLPLMTDMRSGGTDSIVIIVCPLTAIIDTQIEKLKACGLSAIHLTPDMMDIPPECQYLFSSPETLLTHGRHLLLSPRVHNSAVGLFIDEGHCIIKWGTNDAKLKKAFRGHYVRLGELRSLLPNSLPVVVMTATATAAARRDIVKYSGLRNFREVILSPNRPNIRYSVVHLPKFDLYTVFKCVLDDIDANNTLAERVIVYCRKKEHCSDLFELFLTTLGPKGFINEVMGDDRRRIFAMFHSKTSDEVKQSVLQSFMDPNGHVRVVFCTVAFGMGLDVKGTYTIMHLGPSNSIEDYLQESGRAGRDGSSQSHAVLVTYPHATSGNVSTEMKAYCKGKTCRRENLLKAFDFTAETARKYLCCDICAIHCDCDLCKNSVDSSCTVEKCVRAMLETVDGDNVVHTLTTSQKLELQSKLLDYRNSLVGDQNLFHGVDITTGFTRALIDSVVINIGMVSCPEMLETKFNFFCKEHVTETWNIICEVLETDSLSDTCIDYISSEETDSDSDTVAVVKQFRRRPLILSSDSE